MRQPFQKKSTNSSIHLACDVSSSIKKAKNELSFFLNQCISGNGTIMIGNSVSTCTPLEFPRVLAEWSRSNSLDKAIRNIMVSSFFSSEVKQGGSALLSCMMLVGKIEKIIEKRSVYESDILGVIESWSGAGLSSKITKEAFYMGGCGCEVSLLESNIFGTRIKCIEGLSQKGNIAAGFSSNLESDFSFSGEAHVFAIDGYVEKISQIHKILEGSSGSTVIIAARGFLPDVVNTLSTNYPSKLNCIPFVVEDWCIPNFLLLEKMGVVCASSDMGSELSSLRIEKPIEVSVDLSTLLIKNSDVAQDRKISIEFGTDLSYLKGLTIDRVKTLLALIRFTSRTGIMKLKYDNFIFYVPTSTYKTASRCTESIENILQNIGSIVTYE